ncbi:DNA repair protein rad18 [Phyllosticta paracitricarpa]|uniref:Postreplication repair E3 ubiquitin-protein ligase RAD18 n=1 Tax=Phyllosticta paracitricarpa TaxID=2016321 RepID=A0ABR1N2F9_9PEZI
MDAGAGALQDSTDWLSTALPSFAQLENALRCQVCKDLFNTPMITSCSHTFCSLCIRRCFADDGKCPTCRTTDSDSKLRRNWTAQEMVDVWQGSRQKALDLASGAGEPASRTTAKKRKLEVPDSEYEDGEEEVVRSRRKTRSSARQSRAQTGEREVEVIEVDASEQGEVVDPEPNDGLVACPMCKQRMKEEAVFPHLDHCTGPPESRSTRKSDRSRYGLGARASTTNSAPPARLPQLTYTLLNDVKLRKKLKELGIPNHGPRALLIRRHKEWINLWNANCDSTRPLTKRQLLSELDSWERSQGGSRGQSSWAGRGAGDVMDKDFKRDGWAESNKNQYDDLIAQARSRIKSAGENAEKEDAGQREEEHDLELEKQDTMEQKGDVAVSNQLNGISIEQQEQAPFSHYPPSPPLACHTSFPPPPPPSQSQPQPESFESSTPPPHSTDAIDAVRAQVDQTSLHSSQIDLVSTAAVDAAMPDADAATQNATVSQVLIPRSPDVSAAAAD